MTDDEMIRMDREAKDLVRESLRRVHAGNQEEATHLVDQAVEKMGQVAAEINRRHKLIMTRIAAARASAAGLTTPGTPPDPDQVRE